MMPGDLSIISVFSYWLFSALSSSEPLQRTAQDSKLQPALDSDASRQPLRSKACLEPYSNLVVREPCCWLANHRFLVFQKRKDFK